MPLLTIIIPAYNEAKTIDKVVSRVENSELPQGFEREIIVINDGSTDETGKLLNKFESRHRVLHTPNAGKGGAVRKGFALCRGDFIIVQDADLEQNPDEFPMLLAPLLNKEADVVFGSRFMGTYRPPTFFMNFHFWINNAYTAIANFIMGYRTTDVWTGYKMYSRKALDAVKPHLECNGIEFELEVAVMLGKCGMRVKDIPISYAPRWYGEGKKTDWKQAIYSLRKLLGFYFRRI